MNFLVSISSPSAIERYLDLRKRGVPIPSEVVDEVICQHKNFTRYIVNRIAVRLPEHVDLRDLHNVAVIGLEDAMRKYDPEKNCSFKTYAEFRVKGAVLDHLRRLDWVPRTVRAKGRELDKLYHEAEQHFGRSVTQEEVANFAGMTFDQFQKLLEEVRGIRFVSLDELRSRDDDERDLGLCADTIDDTHTESPLSALEMKERRRAFLDAIDSLPERPRCIFRLYYYEGLLFQKIAEILGITESRVCQIHRKAEEKLRKKLRKFAEE
jgi:RNA polymerase sigma factor for flagellar operon FliA